MAHTDHADKSQVISAILDMQFPKYVVWWVHAVFDTIIAFELYLKVVFKGKGGVSTGRLLAAVNRPH